MTQARLEQLKRMGINYRSMGNLADSVECWREALTLDPDDGELHAQLSLTLLMQKRIYAAEIESHLALAAAPMNDLAHHARARVLIAQRKPKAAVEHIDQALALAPLAGYNHTAKADILTLLGQHDQAHESLTRALQLDPEDADLHAIMGDWYLRRGQIQEAEQRAQEALELQADNFQALLLMGNIALRRGDLEDAREHCIWALRQNPNDPSAIHLLCAIKARRSWLLGLWWRFQSFLVTFGPAWIVAILLGLYLVNRIITMVLLDMGQTDAAHTVQLAWLAFVIYTWIAPSLFQRMVQKELKQVLLRSDY